MKLGDCMPFTFRLKTSNTYTDTVNAANIVFIRNTKVYHEEVGCAQIIHRMSIQPTLKVSVFHF